MSSKITYKDASSHRTEMRDWFDYRGYLEIWQNGEVRLLRRHQSEGTPSRAFNGLDIEFRFSGPSARSMVTFVNSEEVQGLISTIHEGHSVAWDGHNHKGVFTDAAKEATTRLEAAICEYHEQCFRN